MTLREALFYEEDGVSLYCGDAKVIVPMLLVGCTSFCLEECSGRCAERPMVIVTDPPYGIGHPTDYASRGRGNLAGCRDYGDKPVWNHPHSKNYPTVIGDDEPFDPSWLLAFNLPMILWGANHYASRLPDASGWLVWDKERPDDLDQATCELAWTNYVKGVRRFRWLWNGMMRASKEPLEHPTQKPEALMRWCLRLKWTPRGTVLDPYMGSGTTIVAAKAEGRRAIGIDLSPAYCEIARQRLAQGALFSASARASSAPLETPVVPDGAQG